ncbi:MAG: TIGR03985 family CRISPR-associated protein [Nostoc sp. DedVER02]|uniref:TIGR03985 family CRISPR-associated protein n=1 Tax=unclassified Nostoc TaxID=2593658 RepID=UPI002AD2ED9A|nr:MULTISPECIES: TIGR03985 family CRISPR-associated protein [unclassified Nostoc]MDZ7987981.1 TIGR03985 family CRISPR-associated protein [Nostoc sp. DedVER02]MDZ8114905.1 TIGR03985 family CRISPR-associated protein [Nostoc sp. DedVER01b]
MVDFSTAPLIEDAPHIELLQWLARGSLKQNLLRAIRLWVWLHSLYGDEEDRLFLPNPFSYKHWRDTFFNATHPKAESAPNLHDVNCACAKTTAQWLFYPKTGLLESEWKRSLQQHDAIPDIDIDELLQQRLFAVTRRTLFADLQILADLGWLKVADKQYYRVQNFPSRPSARELEPVSNRLGVYDLGFLNPNLEAIAQNLSQPIQNVQRFHLEVDYIISQTQNQVEKWLDEFRNLWEQPIIAPICLNYTSAKYGAVECIVYPVCIYYVQRAIYLCGFGKTPTNQGEWYNYRLDKIQKITPLDWNDTKLPKILRQRRTTLPTPDYIRSQMHQAWGFDFYLPSKLMLLRFDRTFAESYLKGTSRHATFKPITYQWVLQLIQQVTSAKHQEALLKILQNRRSDDAYYTVTYRDGDPNVGLRLRAWRPKVEVLLPWELRQKITKEVEAEWQFYQTEFRLSSDC